MRNLLLTMFLLLNSQSAHACNDSGQSDKANFDNCMAHAQQGNGYAQAIIGAMYRLGQGVTQDYKQAVKWNRKAAEQGVAISQYNLAKGYRNGEGVTQDDEQAVKWYRKAAEQGDAYAQNSLGVAYEQGKGVKQDKKLAHMWFNIAASSGHESATEGRDRIANKLSSSEIEKAQRWAREWTAKH
jgi:TPR repeat protein